MWVFLFGEMVVVVCVGKSLSRGLPDRLRLTGEDSDGDTGLLAHDTGGFRNYLRHFYIQLLTSLLHPVLTVSYSRCSTRFARFTTRPSPKAKCPPNPTRRGPFWNPIWFPLGVWWKGAKRVGTGGLGKSYLPPPRTLVRTRPRPSDPATSFVLCFDRREELLYKSV